MAYGRNDSDEYLPSSDDSNEEDERPNRWTGPPSTWQQLNSAEIDTLTALNAIRNQDLSVHLYNAFTLKHRHDRNRRKARDATKPEPDQDVDIETGQPVQEDKWVPPNLWTAWPLPATAVPLPGFMGRTDDAEERFTFRMQASYTPKAELEDTISAAVLRLAKERFQARQEAAQPNEDTVGSRPASSDEAGSDTEMSSKPSRVRPKSRSKTSSKARSVKYESAGEGDMMDVDDLHVEKQSSPPLSEILPLKTVVATDDELSYTLLRPLVRGILAKLDTTLTVLHNAQESKNTCSYGSDASDESSRPQSRSRSHFRSRSRRPSKTHSQSPGAKRRRVAKSRASSIAQETPEAPDGIKKRGRPRKVYPRLDGETDKAYAIRIARLRKEPIPSFADDEPEPVSDSTPAPNSTAEYRDTRTRTKPRGRRPRTQSRPRRRGSEALSDITLASQTKTNPHRPPILARVRLRDWRDILGAAALAGFPAPALDRAARRCADLFGQNFTLHTLQEGPPHRTKLDEHVHYTPGMTIPYFPEDSEDDDNEGPPGLRSRTSRATSAAPSESESRGRGRGRGSSSTSGVPRSRSKSRSASAAGGMHFCIFNNCPRAVDPFTRRQNLIRHLRLMHKYDEDELPVDVDSQDEMHGAVHVDGFLKPIRIRPGWRSEDAAKEKRRPRRHARRNAEMANMRMRDADSTTDHEESSD
ncbi:RNA polymerase I-specific transcription initiation factor-domain-containing protein [Xylaria sp. FL1777]|nr:RNA polymerase I-specific transcription initiation factor-domain-containing protein [Xylaria sp. FL1777]